jgi:hypothetical protein
MRRLFVLAGLLGALAAVTGAWGRATGTLRAYCGRQGPGLR